MEPENNPYTDEYEAFPASVGPPAKLQRKSPINIGIGSSRHRPTGVVSDSGFKKYLSNKYKFNITDPISRREPYYSKDDIIQSIYERLLNIKTK